ncbi:hypothetical protein P20652_0713 [Pseudoalteromonas sp. BSi20652]|uniref:DUF4124 domain-containing protein n=1 Tax=Pseudoalteromonas sp. BSi20652 TaxID=388384 RepID=UPI0002319641|nr:DUF4124 domain-containing protein [Pseudoalteromonas sp. BSi20652]GAA58854.1 hypothetical protein P20652_0713 [Pseudoalteromonas sp. BSi20652]
MNNKILLLIIALGLSNYGYAGESKIYAWKDKNGVLVFSDTPHKGATEIKLTSQDLNIPAANTDIFAEKTQSQQAAFNIAISSPEHNQTIRENTGSVYVTSRITPRFETGFTIQLFIDGKAHGPAINSSTFAIRDVERGEHTLQLKLFNSKNQIIATSQPCIFFMHRKG